MTSQRIAVRAAHGVAARRPTQPLRLLAVLVGTALASLASPSALADSGVTAVEPLLGNALNPWGFPSARLTDPEFNADVYSRSPTGFLYKPAWLLPERPASAGWRVGGVVEAGGLKLVGDDNNAKFREYKSLNSGFYLNHLGVSGDNGKGGVYFDVLAGALGRGDQYAGVTFGRYNSWRLKLAYTELDHVFTTRYRSLWSGVGSERLTLNGGLSAGPAAPATAATVTTALQAAIAATPYQELSIERRRGALRYDLTLSDTLKVFAGYSAEDRKGSRPFGLVMGGGGGTGGVEIPESIDHQTHDLIAGVNWASGATSANVLATVSLFRNGVDTMTVDSPLFVAAANGLTRYPQARYDLYPDNKYYNLKAEVAHAVPQFARSRFTGTFSFSSSRQDDNLIPMTSLTGVAVNGVAGGAWDTTASLSRQSADAKIDTRLADLGWAFTPVGALDLRAKLRRYETTNSTDYVACNPLTGQIGRLVNDGSGGAFATPNVTAGVNPTGTLATGYNAALCNFDAVRALNLVPAAGNAAIRNVPYEHKQTNLSLSGDLRMSRAQNLNFLVERELIDREHRERSETQETRLKVGYVNRALAGGTFRGSIENTRRRGSRYNPDPYEEFLSASLGPFPGNVTGLNVTSWIHTNGLHRKFDLADRDQWILNLRWNHALREDLDLSIGTQWKEMTYPDSKFGRASQRQGTVNADVNWQPNPRTGLYAYAVAQDARMSQRGNQQNACVLGNTYYLYSDGSINTTGTLTAAQTAAGIRVVANSGAVTAGNFESLCGTSSDTSPLYPTSRSFTMEQTDSTLSFGGGIRHDFGKALADFSFARTDSRTRINYTFNPAALGIVTSGAPTAAQLNTLGLIGSGFPDLTYRTDTFSLSVLVPVRPQLAVRLIARYDVGRIRDWHYDGVDRNPVPGAQQVYLDAGPESWRNRLFGVMVQYGF